MTFIEYWDSLFKGTAVPLVHDRANNLFPVRLADRKVADHFYQKGFEAGEQKGYDTYKKPTGM